MPLSIGQVFQGRQAQAGWLNAPQADLLPTPPVPCVIAMVALTLQCATDLFLLVQGNRNCQSDVVGMVMGAA